MFSWHPSAAIFLLGSGSNHTYTPIMIPGSFPPSPLTPHPHAPLMLLVPPPPLPLDRFAGASAQAGIIHTRRETNRQFYGRDVSPEELLKCKVGNT